MEATVVIKRIIIACACCLLLVALPLCTLAASTPTEIKVGYVANYGTLQSPYVAGAEGYGYEYLTQVLQYTENDYTLTFVQCTDWQDGLDKLDRDEIDLLGPTKVREPEDEAYLYTNNDFGDRMMFLAALEDADVYYGDYDAINGATIGVPDYYTDDSSLMAFLQEEGLRTNIVTMPSNNITATMQEQGIDYVLMSSLQTQTGLKVVARLSTAKVYYIASRENTNLVAEIDQAMETLAETEYLYRAQLYLKYSEYSIAANAYISEEEYSLLQENGTYYVGVRNFYSPLCREGADGNLEGVIFDVMELLAQDAGIKIEYILLDDAATDEMYAMTDFVMLATSNTPALGFVTESDDYLELPVLMIEKESVPNDPTPTITTIGVAEYYQVGSILTEGYLYGREVHEYETLQALQQAFDAGEVDSILVTVGALNMIQGDFTTENYITDTTDIKLNLSLAFSGNVSNEEIAVFNKLISRLDGTTLESAIIQYSTAVQSDDVMSFLKDHKWLVYNSVVLTALIVVLVIVVLERRRRLLLAKLLNEDELTGLLTERKLMQDAVQLIREKPDVPFTCVTVDIDNFKYINEIYGYHIGTALLKTVAHYVQQIVVDFGLVARGSADNFLIIAPLQQTQNTFAETDKITSVICEVIQREIEITYPICFSVGIYEVVDREMDVNVMIDCANIARAYGKGTTGTSVHYFTETMRAERANNNEIVAVMAHAIENEEFVLYYQPKVEMKTGALVGAEVLVRWLRDGKVVPPNQFIPLFEKNGFIETLDYYVLAQACVFLQQQSAVVSRLSVNLSGVSLLRPEIVQNILACLKKHDILPTQIDLEITETAFVENGVALARLGELRAYGFTVSMDDFGTGVSSLNRLKNIELDTIKIDRSFIIDSIENPRGGKILRHAVQMAKDLSLEVVAEGVETIEQHVFLKDLQCDIGQGYFYAPPMPESDFLQYCKSLNNM